MSSHILRHPNTNLPFVVYTDASGPGLGSILEQCLTDRQEEVLAYASQSLTAPRRIIPLQNWNVYP